MILVAVVILVRSIEGTSHAPVVEIADPAHRALAAMPMADAATISTLTTQERIQC